MSFKPIFAVLMIVLAACFVVAQGEITEDDIISNSLIDKKAVASGMDDSLTSSDSRVSPNSKKIRSTGGSSTNTNTNTSTGSVVNSGGSGGSNNNDDESNGRRLPPISLPLEDLSTDVSSDDEENDGFSAITGAVIGAVGKRGVYGIIGLLLFVAILGAYVYTKKRQQVKN